MQNSRQEPAWQVGESEQSGQCGWDIVNEGERYMKLEVGRGPVRKGPIGLESHRKESEFYFKVMLYYIYPVTNFFT